MFAIKLDETVNGVAEKDSRCTAKIGRRENFLSRNYVFTRNTDFVFGQYI